MSRSSCPAVTVILPVRDGMPYLPRAIESILSQTWSDFELLVVDDGSVDQTRAYLATVTDARVRVLATGGAGLAAALNAALAAARAPFVARQDADDWSLPTRLALQRAWLRAHPSVDVLATAVQFVDATGAPFGDAWTEQIRAQWDAAVTPEHIAALMPLTCCIFHATVMARTDVLRHAGGYDATMVPAEDYDLWLRLLPETRFARLPEPLYTVRVHRASSSAVRRSDQIDRVITAKLRYLRRVAPGLPPRPSLAVPCADRGAILFQRIGPIEGFTVREDGPGPPSGAADVVAVTDFSALDRYVAELTADGRYIQVGNLFVRVDLVGAGQRRPQPLCAGGQSEATSDRL